MSGLIACRNVLLSGQTGPTTSAAATSVFYTPEIRADSAVETVYKFVVESVSGSPTTASLAVKFQGALRTTGGGLGDTTKFTDKTPVWADLSEADHPGLLPGGDWPATLATESLASAALFIRRIVGGFSHRLAITPTFTGGSSPGFVMSVECEVRY